MPTRAAAALVSMVVAAPVSKIALIFTPLSSTVPAVCGSSGVGASMSIIETARFFAAAQ